MIKLIDKKRMNYYWEANYNKEDLYKEIKLL